MLTSPMLFMVFNRPDETRRVFEQIARVQPKKLYVAADGPRTPEEAERCRQVREIATAVDWDCELKTLFRERNLGCRLGCKGAIDWFFASEPEGIVLEDDCVPSPPFFPFCEELLERYRDDERVGGISGSSYLKPYDLEPDSYYFSRYPLYWGWASWARAWRHYDLQLTQWPVLRDTDFLARIGGSSRGFQTYWKYIFDEFHEGRKTHTWDYQMLFSFWTRNYSFVVPNRNLVVNIGFEQGTHHQTYDAVSHGRLAAEMIFPLVHPKDVVRSPVFDDRIDQEVHHTGWFAMQQVFQRSMIGRWVWKQAKALYYLAKPAG